MRLRILELTGLMSVVVAAATLSACGDGDGGTEPGPTPTISIGLSAPTLSIMQGANGTVNVALTRGGGFSGAVGVAIEGAPAGVTAAAAPASIPAGSTSSVITIAAAATTAPGNYTLTVRATGAGVSASTATIALTVTAAPVQSYTLAVTQSTVSVAQGASGTADVSLTRTGGFAGAVALTAEGLPTGVTHSFSPVSVTANASVLTLNVGAAAAPGNSTITVRGTATGQTDKTATFTLTVTAAPGAGFTIAVTPTIVSVQQGGMNTATVTVTRTMLVGDVSLSATGLPAGVTATFDPPSVTATTSLLRLSASASAAVGQATVTIRGTAPPFTEQSATLTLNVTAATGGAGNTTWEFCSAADMPLWLAVQDGNGPWARVTPTGTRFQFNIASANGGVAYVSSTTDAAITSASAVLPTRAGARTALLVRNNVAAARSSGEELPTASLVDGFDLTVVYATQAELNAQGGSQCLAGAGKIVNGTVANVSVTETASISLGDAFAEVSGGVTTFQLTGVPDGPLDLVASRGTFDLMTLTSVVDRIIIRRGVDAPNNSTLPVLDFNAFEAFAPAEANITVANLGTDTPVVFTSYFTASGTGGAGLFSGFGTGTGPFKYYGVPTSRQIAGDLHFAFVIAAPATTTADVARFAGLFFSAPTDRTITLGATLPAQTVSVAATSPYARLRAQGSVTAAYNKYVEAVFTQSTAAVLRAASIGASSGYLANATTYDFTIPDFTGTAGWDNLWGPRTGVETAWTVSGVGFTGIGVNEPNPVEGSTIQGALRSGTITP